MGVLRCLLVLLALPVLGGCLMLERAPAQLACDPGLAGRWEPLPNRDAENPLDKGDYVVVDAQCRVTLVDTAKPNERPGFTARSFVVAEQRYLALSQDDMRELFEDKSAPAPTRLPASAVMPVQYRFAGDELQLQVASAGYLGEQIKRGTIQVTEVDNFVMLTGSDAQLRQVLTDHPQLFPGETPLDNGMTESPSGKFFRLRRMSGGATP